MPLVTGTTEAPTFVFDADLTIGIDAEAQHVVDTVRDAIERLPDAPWCSSPATCS